MKHDGLVLDVNSFYPSLMNDSKLSNVNPQLFCEHYGVYNLPYDDALSFRNCIEYWSKNRKEVAHG